MNSPLAELNAAASVDSIVTWMTDFSPSRPDSIGIAAWIVEASTRENNDVAVAVLQRLLAVVPDHRVALAGLEWFSGIKDAVAELEELERNQRARLAEKAQRAEEARLAEELRIAEEARIAEELQFAARLAEEARLAEVARVAEELRLAEEIQQAARLAEEARIAEEARLAKEAEAARQAAEAARIAREAENEQARLAALAQSTKSTRPAKPQATPADGQRKLKILAVDDSATIRKVVAMTLSLHGFEIISAADGIEALTLLSDCKPDIILSDIQMPRLDGYKLCKFVKKHPSTSQIPVILLSGKDGMFDKMRGKMSGCDGHIRKPFEANELLAQINKILGIPCT